MIDETGGSRRPPEGCGPGDRGSAQRGAPVGPPRAGGRGEHQRSDRAADRDLAQRRSRRGHLRRPGPGTGETGISPRLSVL